jgi:hypothetical protein
MTGVGMIGTPVMTGVVMGHAMTTVGATTAASVMPTGGGMIAWVTIAARMIGVSTMATDGATIAISGTTIGAVESQPTWGQDGSVARVCGVGHKESGSVAKFALGRGDTRAASCQADLMSLPFSDHRHHPSGRGRWQVLAGVMLGAGARAAPQLGGLKLCGLRS